MFASLSSPPTSVVCDVTSGPAPSHKTCLLSKKKISIRLLMPQIELVKVSGSFFSRSWTYLAFVHNLLAEVGSILAMAWLWNTGNCTWLLLFCFPNALVSVWTISTAIACRYFSLKTCPQILVSSVLLVHFGRLAAWTGLRIPECAHAQTPQRRRRTPRRPSFPKTCWRPPFLSFLKSAVVGHLGFGRCASRSKSTANSQK